MRLTGTAREKPEPGAKSVDGLPTRDLEADGPDYDTAYAALVDQLPDGWQLLFVR